MCISLHFPIYVCIYLPGLQLQSRPQEQCMHVLLYVMHKQPLLHAVLVNYDLCRLVNMASAILPWLRYWVMYILIYLSHC